MKQLVKRMLYLYMLLVTILSFLILNGCETKTIIKEVKVPYEVKVIDSIPSIIYDTVVISKHINGKDSLIIRYYPKYHYTKIYMTKKDTICITDTISKPKLIKIYETTFINKIKYGLLGIGFIIIILCIIYFTNKIRGS